MLSGGKAGERAGTGFLKQTLRPFHSAPVVPLPERSGANVVERASTLFARGFAMLWTIVVILVILWLLGVGLHIAGGLIHILLIVALVVGLVQLFTGRRV
jgi:hypothetical protein